MDTPLSSDPASLPTGENPPAPQAAAENDDMHWYCLRTQKKREHISAAYLRQMENMEVFCPRIKFKRKTRTGTSWAVEAMFPSYVFARFNVKEAHGRVCYAPGVVDVLKFGKWFGIIPREIIAGLKQHTGDVETVVIEQVHQPGEEVEIVSGSMRGISALVTQVLSAGERIRVLLDFFGRSVEAELKSTDVVPSTRQMAGHPLKDH